MRKFLASPLALALLAASTQAQSLNVDFESASNPFGPLSATYGGAAASPGTWNSVSTLSATNLLSLSGAPTSVDVAASSHPGSAFFGYYDHPNTTGEDQALLDDLFTDDTDQFHMVFTGLSPGEYDVYTYLVAPPFNSCFVEVMGSPDGVRQVGGTWTGAHAEGSDYVQHRIEVAGDTIDVRIQQVQPHGQALIGTSGIQLVRLVEYVGEPLCYGDGTGAACPCSNPGDPGRGCQNSAGTGGAGLVATGTISPDTVVFHSSGELPSALTIFLQGQSIVGPVNFGDGLRCAGSPLLRLFVKHATGGEATAPGPGDPSVTARAAALGHAIQAGDRRYYQTYYRDPSAGFCSPPQGAAFNASQVVKIVW